MKKILLSLVLTIIISSSVFASAKNELDQDVGDNPITRSIIGFHLQTLALSQSYRDSYQSFEFSAKYLPNVSLDIPLRKFSWLNPDELPSITTHLGCNFCSELSSESDIFKFTGANGEHYETPLWSISIDSSCMGLKETHTQKLRELYRLFPQKHEFSIPSYGRLEGMFHVRQNLWELLHHNPSSLSNADGINILSVSTHYTYNSFLVERDLPWYKIIIPMNFEWLVDQLWEYYQLHIPLDGPLAGFYILKPHKDFTASFSSSILRTS